MINRGRDGMVNAGAVSEGCSRECQWFVVRPFKHTAETDSTDTAFQGHPTPKFALPRARALIEGSARDPQPPTAIAPTGTKPRRSVVVARP